jgi:hypothetical protein
MTSHAEYLTTGMKMARMCPDNTPCLKWQVSAAGMLPSSLQGCIYGVLPVEAGGIVNNEVITPANTLRRPSGNVVPVGQVFSAW